MKEYEFCFTLDIDYDQFDAWSDKIYAAAPDGTYSISGNKCHLDIAREAESLEKAIVSALEGMKQIGVKVLYIYIQRLTPDQFGVQGA